MTIFKEKKFILFFVLFLTLLSVSTVNAWIGTCPCGCYNNDYCQNYYYEPEGGYTYCIPYQPGVQCDSGYKCRDGSCLLERTIAIRRPDGTQVAVNTCYGDAICQPSVSYSACAQVGWHTMRAWDIMSNTGWQNAYYCGCVDGSTQSQGCGYCGTQTRVCSGGNWGSWSACTGEGVCSPESKQCSGAWVQTCSSGCAWTNTQNCDSSDGWYNTGGAYACCDGNNACSSCQDQQYRDYYCSGQSCTYSVTGSQTVKSGCTNCDSSDGCSGDSYLDYYCSGGACTYTSDACSDCSCSCGDYNVVESVANGNCADSKDNNCNSESDYDSSDGRHGDSGCPVGVTSISVSSSTPIVGTSITVDCTSTVAGVNSISANVDGVGSCSWQSWSGSVARFSCNVGSSFGSRVVRCFVDTSKSYKSGSDQTKEISVLASVCSDYPGSSSCEWDSRCDWCPECVGVKYTGGVGRCVSSGGCPSAYCWKDKCGAVCDTTNGGCASTHDCDSGSCSCVCSTSKCNAQGTGAGRTGDGCLGDSYIDYSCSGGACTYTSDACSDCSCSCGNYNTAEASFCEDRKDNDCDGFKDHLDTECPGCPVGYQVCADGSCKADCPADPPCNSNGACETGEGCTCGDCYGKEDSCIDGAVCDSSSNVCSCPVGTSLCADGTCNADCGADPGCNSNGVCESGEGCTCGDCYGEEDDCISEAVCDSTSELCACSGKQLCSDGTCKDACNICGNGILEPGEECDGLTLPPEIQNCNNIDTLKGSISCTDCFITGCTDGAATCGDDVIQTGETCDNINIDGKTCASFGFDKGELTCFSSGLAQECHFDTAGCFDEPAGCDKDGTCDASETCACEDCLNKKANECIYGQICDNTARCKCEDGTTLCGDGTCRPPTLCDTLPGCEGGSENGICESGEGCDCQDCEQETDTCKSSSTCINEVCTACSILKAYWTEDCIGSGKEVSMKVEGTPGCAGRTVTLDLYEDDPINDDYAKTTLAIFDDNKKAEYKWNAEFPDELINEGCPLCDATKTPGNPPENYLEYYFIAKIGGESFQSEDVLKVHYCIPDCDEDCDTFIDNDKQNNIVKINGVDTICKDLEDYPYLTEGKAKIDANPKSGYCEDCREDGLSPGQERCAAYYDCTPGWWKDSPPGEWAGKINPDDAEEGLDWGDCGESKGATGAERAAVTDLTRNRLVCPPGLTKGQCCAKQEDCYCKLPDAETMAEFNCDNPDFRPTEIKACLAEEKFPFFTNMNMLITVLVLIGFYIWKNRAKEKTKTRK